MPTHYRGTVAERRALDTYIKLARASDAVVSEAERHLHAFGLSGRQLGVLEALHHLGPLAQKDLSQKLLCSRANVTVVVDQLAARGLVVRSQDPDDRRSNVVATTREGEKLIRVVFRDHVLGIVRMMSALTAGEQRDLDRLCRKLGLAVGRK